MRDLKWEVYYPNTGNAVGEPGSTWTLGIRSRGNQGDRFELTTKVTGPDGVTRETTQVVEGPEWALSKYPNDFPGADTEEIGSYAIVFDVEGVRVGRDSLRIIEAEPPNTAIDFVMESPFVTSDGTAIFNASVENLSSWYATEAVIHLALRDAAGNEVQAIDQPIGDLGPGQEKSVNVARVPANVNWELYGAEITWFWEPP